MRFPSVSAVIAIAVAGFSLISAGPSSANTVYNWSWDGTQIGTLTTDSGAPGCGAGCETIVSITGTWFSEGQITGLLPAGTFGNSDNHLLPSASALLDFHGFSFSTASSQHNIFFSSGYEVETLNVLSNASGTFAISAASAGPGPVIGSGLPGLVVAAAGLAAWWRRRQKAVVVAS